jgi:hypothetical protein
MNTVKKIMLLMLIVVGFSSCVVGVSGYYRPYYGHHYGHHYHGRGHHGYR